jgi:hypothetical protein
MLDGEVYSSHSERSEYADIAPEVVEAVATITPATQPRTRRTLRRVRDWLRSRYGLREIIIPEKFRVASHHDVVVTYSSCLALVYFAEDTKRIMHDEIMSDARRRDLYHGLLAHEGIGLVATLTPEGVHVEGKHGRGVINDASLRITSGRNPMDAYGTETYVLRAVESLVRQPNAGDCVLFGSYDGYDIVSFDDQVGAHGSAGGDQVYPFLITPSWLNAANETLEDARDIHRAVLLKYSEGQSPQ